MVLHKIQIVIYVPKGLGHPRLTGMHSYPNFGGLYKALNYPDIASLAQLAENAQADLRVIVLQRKAKDILKSTLVRGFGEIEPKILNNCASALFTQLKLVDHRFVMCVQYEDFYSDTIDHSIWLQFIHQNFTTKFNNEILHIAKEYRSSHEEYDLNNFTWDQLHLPDYSKYENFNVSAMLDYYSQQLHARLQLIHTYCEQSKVLNTR
jgi:hypothetical protein